MSLEHPEPLDGKYKKMFDNGKEKMDNKIEGIINETDKSSERYVNALKILEKASAGDQEIIDKLIPFFKNKEGEQEYEDVSQYIIDKFNNPLSIEGVIDRDKLIELSKEAFEKMINEKEGLNYFRNN